MSSQHDQVVVTPNYDNSNNLLHIDIAFDAVGSLSQNQLLTQIYHIISDSELISLDSQTGYLGAYYVFPDGSIVATPYFQPQGTLLVSAYYDLSSEIITLTKPGTESRLLQIWTTAEQNMENMLANIQILFETDLIPLMDQYVIFVGGSTSSPTISIKNIPLRRNGTKFEYIKNLRSINPFLEWDLDTSHIEVPLIDFNQDRDDLIANYDPEIVFPYLPLYYDDQWYANDYDLPPFDPNCQCPNCILTPNMDVVGAKSGGSGADPGSGSKAMQPVIPNVPSGAGNTDGCPPVHADAPASSTVASTINAPSDPQIRATRDMPSQIPLMSMVGGPPMMAGMNMYQDDFLNLVYREFDYTQITVQGGQAKGTIVASFPYGINLLNPYAQNWARLHKRYNGRIRLTFSISAVPLLKGNLLIGVVRNMPPSGTTSFSTVTLQKINWAIINLNGSGDYSIDIGDARQTEFFRNISEDPVGADPTDLENRPGIIACVYTQISNQFGGDADTSVVLNVRSQAISPAEDPTFGFYAFEPYDAVVAATQPNLTNSIPQNFFLTDLLPRYLGRSLFLDGNKIQNVDYNNLTGNGRTVPTLNGITGPPTIPRLVSEPILMDSTTAVTYMTDMDPKYLQWTTVLPDGNLANLIPQITSGGIINTDGFDNDFLGYYNNLTPTANPFFEIVGESGAVPVQSQYYAAVYKRGTIWFYIFTYTLPTGEEPLFLRKLFPNDQSFENQARAINGGFPSSNNTLPADYYNCIVAVDGQVLPTQPIANLPILIPDDDFTSILFKLRSKIFSNSSSSANLFAIDLVDYRDGQQVGTLCTYGNQVVLRTSVPNPGRSHYRFTLDLEFIQLTNPRMVSVVPNSLSSPFLQLFEPASLDVSTIIRNRLNHFKTSDPIMESLIKQLSSAFCDESIQPNAALAAMAIGGGILSGAGQGLGSYFESMQRRQMFEADQARQAKMQQAGFENQQKLQASNFSFQQDLDKKRRDFRAQMRGFDSMIGVPGSFQSKVPVSRPGTTTMLHTNGLLETAM